MKFNIYTLGCKVNTYESNVMSDLLKENGFVEVKIDEMADISIINTCTVTNTADNKSMKIIRHAIKKNPNAIIVVCGCMSQHRSHDVENIEGVDIVLGNKNKSQIVSYINKYIDTHNKKSDIYNLENIPFETMKLNNFNKVRAFVKIQDGCNNFCTYCIIPYTRGNVRSKDKDSVLSEINNLIKEGHKEIVLTGIHTGHYGSEFDNYSFSDLLEDILKIKGLERLRISSIEITELDDKFFKLLNDNKILVDHMHIPLQTGTDSVLKRMNRKYNIDYFINKIEKIRTIRPDISITTDVIVGFPGETDEEFNNTIENIKKINFSKIHVFPFSKRDGTKASLMDNQIEPTLKKERVKKLINISKELEMNYMNKFINKDIIMLPEVYKDGYLIGHTGNYLLVKVKGTKEELNQDKKVKIVEVNYPYVIGK